MAKTQFQKDVDAVKAVLVKNESDAERENLELTVPIIGQIMAKVSAGIDDAKYMVAELGTTLPLMTELSQTVNVAENVLGNSFAEKAARLAELQGDGAGDAAEDDGDAP